MSRSIITKTIELAEPFIENSPLQHSSVFTIQIEVPARQLLVAFRWRSFFPVKVRPRVLVVIVSFKRNPKSTLLLGRKTWRIWTRKNKVQQLMNHPNDRAVHKSWCRQAKNRFLLLLRHRDAAFAHYNASKGKDTTIAPRPWWLFKNGFEI